MINSVNNRQIRIFISSTFQDMQAERDYLITKVFPRLQFEAAKRDVSIVPLDLRWGVTEEQSQKGEVIQVCLQEIENSHPFFIGIIGNRYGWAPTESEFQKNEILRERWGNWLEEDVKNKLSLTEIEMQYGVLRSKEHMDANFFIKESGDPDTEEDIEKKAKLKNLKLKILNNGRYPVKGYQTPEELGKFVEEAVLSILNEKFPLENSTKEEIERMAQDAFIHSRTQTYIPIEENFEELDNFLDSDKNLCVISGNSGIGKSSLLVNWLIKHQNDGYIQVFYSVGCGNHTESTEIIETNIIGIIKNECTIDFANSTSLAELFSNIPKEYKLLIVIDGINLLEDETDKNLAWLPTSSQNIKYIVSTLPQDASMEFLRRRDCKEIQVKPFSAYQKSDFISTYLGLYGKSLSTEQLRKITSAPVCENTLVLKSLLNELVNFGKHEELSNRIDFYISSVDVDAFFQRVLERIEADYGQNVISMLLSLIAFSRNGLEENELLSICKISQLEWSQIYCALQSHFSVRNGLLWFSHKNIARAVLNRYSAKELEARQLITKFFEKECTKRAVLELAYQFFMMNEAESLYRLLGNIESYLILSDNDIRRLPVYWHYLIKKNKDKFTPQIYLQQKRKPSEELATTYINIGQFFARIYLGKDAIPYYKKAEELLDLYSGIMNPLRSKNLNNLGDYYYGKRSFEEALNCYSKALHVNQTVQGKLYEDTALSMANVGRVYSAMRQYEKAKKLIRESIEISKIVSGEYNIPAIYHNKDLADIEYYEGNYGEAIKLYIETITQWTEYYSERELLIALCNNKIAECYFYFRDYSQSLQYNLQALRIANETLGNNHPYLAALLEEMGETRDLQGEAEASKELYQQALNVYNDISVEGGGTFETDIKRLQLAINGLDKQVYLLDRNKQNVTSKNIEETNGSSIREELLHDVEIIRAEQHSLQEGRAKMNSHKFDEALSSFLQALQLLSKTKTFEDCSLEYLRCHNAIHSCAIAAEKFDIAETHLVKATDITRKLYGDNHKETAKLYKSLAIFYQQTNRAEKSIEIHHRAIKILENLTDVNSTLANSYFMLGCAYSSNNQHELSLRPLRKALDLQKSMPDNDPIAIATTYTMLGNEELFLQYVDKGVQHLQQAYDIFIKVEGANSSQAKLIKRRLNDYKQEYINAPKQLPTKGIEQSKTTDTKPSNQNNNAIGCIPPLISLAIGIVVGIFTNWTIGIHIFLLGVGVFLSIVAKDGLKKENKKDNSILISGILISFAIIPNLAFWAVSGLAESIWTLFVRCIIVFVIFGTSCAGLGYLIGEKK